MKDSELIIRPRDLRGASGVALEVLPEKIGFEYLKFQARGLAAGEKYSAQTGAFELGLVLLAGRCDIESPLGRWDDIGRRSHVFGGLPYALYLPVDAGFTVSARTDCQLAFCYCKAENPYPARLVTPDEVEVEIRGGGNATRQINKIFQPDFPAHRLLVVEVFTPSGNWSSYPPHKHDAHHPPEEVDLEEFYYYRIDRPEGFAVQKVYNPDRSLDATLTVRDGELVLVPEGYHPVVAAPGYNVYYLNALAGSARSMAAADDPALAWVRDTWKDKDPRVPLVTRGMSR